jgi:hypothetical protein
MLREEVTVQTKGRDEVKFNYNFSENTEEAITMYENNNVHELFKRALTIAAQANARKMLAQGYTAERIQIEMDQWKPGISLSTRGAVKTVDPVKVITENFDDWTPERQEEIFRLIQERFASRGATPAVATPDVNGEPTPEDIEAITVGMNGDTPDVATIEPEGVTPPDESEGETPPADPTQPRRRR